jgi:chymotrypsin
MKLLIGAVLAVLAVSAQAEDNWEIDWSKVVPRTEIPGFWDNRIVKPLLTSQFNRNGRIVGGQVVTPHAHPYQAGLLMQFAGGTGLCGGSVISPRTIFTAAHW